MHAIDPTHLELPHDKFKQNPSGPHSPALQRLLKLLRWEPIDARKEQADDWVWIVDHTVQIGQEKCLVILGVRLSALAARDHCLSHADVEPLSLSPVEQSNGDVVFHQLQETVAKTGVPRQIVGDQGSDLHAGIKAFCQAHAETCSIYDIKHKTACVLKHELQDDADWQRFTRLAAQSKLKVQQTSLAFLAPLRQDPMNAWSAAVK